MERPDEGFIYDEYGWMEDGRSVVHPSIGLFKEYFCGLIVDQMNIWMVYDIGIGMT
jgi:hypothetical protein